VIELLQFRFAGERSYLHSTDLYDSCVGMVRRHFRVFTLRDLALKVQHWTANNILATDEPSELPGIGEFRCLINLRQNVNIGLHDSDTPIFGTHEFDEQRITGQARTNAGVAVLSKNVAESDAHCIVALNKLLLSEVQPLEDTEQWAFTRMTASIYTDYTDYSQHPLILHFRRRLRSTYISDYAIETIAKGEVWFTRTPRQ